MQRAATKKMFFGDKGYKEIKYKFLCEESIGGSFCLAGAAASVPPARRMTTDDQVGLLAALRKAQRQAEL